MIHFFNFSIQIFSGPKADSEVAEKEKEEVEKRPDLILITGSSEKCEAAKNALLVSTNGVFCGLFKRS